MHRKERFIQKIRGLSMLGLPATTSSTAVKSTATAKSAPITGSTAKSAAAATAKPTAAKTSHE
jgi:hypothetical protein